MACGEPSPQMQQLQLTMCQLCGRDMDSCNDREEINYQKQVDPPVNPYTQIIPDYRYDEDEEGERRKKGIKSSPRKSVPIQICIPFPAMAAPPPPAPCKADSQPKKPEESEKNGSAGSSSVMKAACLPTGGPCPPPPVKMMLCLPCPPPDSITKPSGSGGNKLCSKGKPTDYTYRCESRELRGGNLYTCCQCNKRNGLQHDCPRTPCQGRPACLTKPWPDCWPSGGNHGIDYTRENGVKRFDPCRNQRFDRKELKPSGAPKADCGGNMMVVVCPPPSPPPC